MIESLGRRRRATFARRLHAIGVRPTNPAINQSTVNHPIPDHLTPNHPITQSPNHPMELGFTMIELLVVVSLIVILATMGMSQYRTSVIHAREAVLKEDLFRMRDAIDQYYADKNQYPSTLDALVSDGYMRQVPEDPFTKSNTTWQTVPAEPDPNNPTAEPGVYNIHSGSEANAIDGTKYSEW
jgi:general secretion pathway protein G